ncbi:MAG: hypothetical protein KKB03_05055 [Nanoarchaeota archaeon]|nr:hypothetical protein [Nanoarchaeota archaeon]
MVDVNLIKNFKISLKKAFDKGEIETVYERMYNIAEKLAIHEAKKWAKSEDYETLLNKMKRDNKNPYREFLSYRNKRIKFHMNEMCRLLELYVKTKNKDN